MKLQRYKICRSLVYETTVAVRLATLKRQSILNQTKILGTRSNFRPSSSSSSTVTHSFKTEVHATASRKPAGLLSGSRWNRWSQIPWRLTRIPPICRCVVLLWLRPWDAMRIMNTVLRPRLEIFAVSFGSIWRL